ncbi:MAG: hypothetical protein SFZ24_03765 [Planctomycetota bacterium]|nr:hypothetical protein [Planctomycetota bacterium]
MPGPNLFVLSAAACCAAATGARAACNSLLVSPSSVAVPGGVSTLATGRVNADAALDIVALDRARTTLHVIFNSGADGFSLGPATALPEAATNVALADVNADSITDAIVALPATQRIAVLPGRLRR